MIMSGSVPPAGKEGSVLGCSPSDSGPLSVGGEQPMGVHVPVIIAAQVVFSNSPWHDENLSLILGTPHCLHFFLSRLCFIGQF